MYIFIITLIFFESFGREGATSWEKVPEGEKYVVWENRRKNFDTGFKRILFWAGLTPWQKLFQNMRANAENDLVEDGYPTHVVGEWIGHTPKMPLQHYLRVLDSYFDKATTDAEKTGLDTRPTKFFRDPQNDPQNGVKLRKNT